MPYYVVVEGDGERTAVPNLLNRWANRLGAAPVWRDPMRINVQRPSDAQRAVDLVRPRTDAEGLLVLRDDEDGCPKDDGPAIAEWFKQTNAPFPVACVLFYREFETLFLPFLGEWAGIDLNGRTGLRADAAPIEDPESLRDAKGVLTRNLPPGRAYKETVDQLAFTRLLDIDALLNAQVPCAETLDRALAFLLSDASQPGDVFPVDR